MVDLLEQIRTAVDELTPLLHRRAVDIEMPRLTVDADATTLQRALVATIGRAAEHTEGAITVRTTKQGTAARIEVTGEYPPRRPARDFALARGDGSRRRRAEGARRRRRRHSGVAHRSTGGSEHSRHLTRRGRARPWTRVHRARSRVASRLKVDPSLVGNGPQRCLIRADGARVRALPHPPRNRRNRESPTVELTVSPRLNSAAAARPDHGRPARRA